MDDVVVLVGGKPAHEVSGELAEKIKSLIYEHSGRISVAGAVGVLEIVKSELMAEQ